MQKTIFITGASRSIGLEFTRQYASENYKVIATCREPDSATELQILSDKFINIVIEQLDISDQKSIKIIAEKYHAQPIDMLINNAGILSRDQSSIASFDKADILKIFDTNFFGTLELTSKLLPSILLSTDKKIITLTTKVASMGDNRSGKNYGYRCSKIALNMAMKNIAIEYRDKGLRVILLHPGWVQTPMGGPSSLISTETSVDGMRQVISNKIESSLADFFEFNGKVVPW